MVAVGIRDYLFEYHSHQILETSTSITRIGEAARRAFDEAWDKTPIRHLGIHTSRVSSEKSRQLGLFDRMDYEKLERMDKAVDEIRRRFGNDAVKRAAFLPEHPGKTAVHDHMGGGIAGSSARWITADRKFFKGVVTCRRSE